MKHLRLIIPTCVATIALAAVVASSVSGSAGDPRHAVGVDVETARANLLAFIDGSAQRSQALVIGSSDVRARLASAKAALGDGRYHRFYQFAGDGANAYVDAHDGEVFLLSISAAAGGRARLDEKAARDIAVAYLADRSVLVEGMDYRASRTERGSELTVFEFTWVAMQGGIELPQRRIVEVDAGSGEVLTVIVDDLPFAPPGDPVVGRDAATTLALGAASIDSGAVMSSALRVDFDASTGAQQLVWRVEVGSTSGYALVIVDATTGKAVVLGRG
jgi:hypothetical protein